MEQLNAIVPPKYQAVTGFLIITVPRFVHGLNLARSQGKGWADSVVAAFGGVFIGTNTPKSQSDSKPV